MHAQGWTTSRINKQELLVCPWYLEFSKKVALVEEQFEKDTHVARIVANKEVSQEGEEETPVGVVATTSNKPNKKTKAAAAATVVETGDPTGTKKTEALKEANMSPFKGESKIFDPSGCTILCTCGF